KGLLDEAMDVILQAEVMAPFELEIQLIKADILIRMHEYNEAIILIDDLKKSATQSDLEEIYLTESVFFEFVQEFDEMFQCLKKALMINPSSEEGLLRMAIAVQQSRNFEESILLHKVIVDNHPYNHLAWSNLGHAFANVGEYEKAIDALEYVFIISPDFEQGYLDCAEYCRESQKQDKALDIYLEAYERFGPDFDLVVNIADCQYALGLLDDAKRSLFEAIELDNYCDESYFLLAKCYMDTEDWHSAVKVLRKAIAIEGEMEEYYHALGTSYKEIGETGRAKYYLRKAAIKGCEQSLYWEDYIAYIIQCADFEQAILALEDADRFTFSYKLQYLEAACHIGLGEIKTGLTLLEDVLEESFDEHFVLFELPEVIAGHKEVQSIVAYYKN
ncbi:MAG: tetratricopeptide repeat protein, partial [Bacteroidota bacterium]